MDRHELREELKAHERRLLIQSENARRAKHYREERQHEEDIRAIEGMSTGMTLEMH